MMLLFTILLFIINIGFALCKENKSRMFNSFVSGAVFMSIILQILVLCGK